MLASSRAGRAELGSKLGTLSGGALRRDAAVSSGNALGECADSIYGGGMLAALNRKCLHGLDAEALQDCLLRSLEFRLGDSGKRRRIIQERLGEARTRFLFSAVFAAFDLGGAPFVWGSGTFWICLVGGVLCLLMAVQARAALRGFAELLRRPELAGSAA